MKKITALFIALLFVVTLYAQVSEVRWVLCIQESIVLEHGVPKVIEGFEYNYEFFEEAVTNGINHWDIDIEPYLLSDYFGTQTLNTVGIEIIPDSMFRGESLGTYNWIGLFNMPNDGRFDQFSPDSLGIKYNQSAVMYVTDNIVTISGGTAGIKSAVVPWTSIGNVNGIYTKIAAHEIAHKYGGSHDHAVELEEYVVIGNDTVAEPTDYTLDRGAGPYSPILSRGAIEEEIMNEDHYTTLIKAAQDHPDLTLHLSNNINSEVNQGDTIIVETIIHESWVKTKPLLIIKDEEGVTLSSNVYSNVEMFSEIIIPSGDLGIYPLSMVLVNPPTNEADTIILTFDIKELTATEDNYLTNKNEIELYPNPANDQITFDLGELSDVISDISIRNTLGAVVFKPNDISQTTFTLDVNDYSNGTYYLNILLQNGQSMKKTFFVLH